jgi:NADPH:quinone reductase-like Zn-dependent oxidoreductase
MKVARLKAPGGVANLRVLDEDPPTPEPGEVVVRIRATSLNPHDDFVVRGAIPAADGRIPLSDGAGEVLALGEGVTDLKIGDTVCLRSTGEAQPDRFDSGTRAILGGRALTDVGIHGEL